VNLEIALQDGRKILASGRLMPRARDWLVCLPGSATELWQLDEGECRSLRRGLGPTSSRYNLMVLNKPGLGLKGRIDDRVFELSFRQEQRRRDYLEALKLLIPKEDRVFLLGFSEGAYLAPQIARLDDRIKALALLSGGTRSWLDEEVFKSRRPEQALRKIAQVYGRPASRTPGWHGLSNATWMSYDNDNTLLALQSLSLPVFTAHGELDNMIDLQTTFADLAKLRQEGKRISSTLHKNVDHTLDHKWLSTLEASARFFAAQTRVSDRPLTTPYFESQTSLA
jgi:pimeloyl-ACP methyl ester carboxylesterase